MKKILFALFLFSITAAFALNCSVCKKQIRGKYIRSNDNKSFCSQKCFASTVPKCAYCKKPCIKGGFNFMKKVYCSKECVENVSKCNSCGKPSAKIRIIINPDGKKMLFCPACTQKPKCYFCVFPNKTQKLSDGRFICAKCKATAVSSQHEIRKIFRKVRMKLHRLFGFDPNHRIELHIIDLPELERRSKGIYQMENGGRIALMRYDFSYDEKTDWRGRKTRTLNHERCRLFILTNTPLEMLEDSMAHELTHDYLRHNAGKLDDLAIEEGFAEAVAAEYNKSVNRKHLNVRKKNTPDKIYGGGYRKMSQMLEKYGFKKTVQYIKSQSKPLF